jgi:hypothetical protein
MASVGRSVRPIENLEGASLSVPTKFVQIDKSADGDFSPARIARRWSPLAAVGPVLLPTDALPSDRSASTAAFAAAFGTAAPPAGAFVRDCPRPHAFSNVVVSSVRDMSWSWARAVMRRYRGPISRSFATGGFRCA